MKFPKRIYVFVFCFLPSLTSSEAFLLTAANQYATVAGDAVHRQNNQVFKNGTNSVNIGDTLEYPSISPTSSRASLKANNNAWSLSLGAGSKLSVEGIDLVKLNEGTISFSQTIALTDQSGNFYTSSSYSVYPPPRRLIVTKPRATIIPGRSTGTIDYVDNNVDDYYKVKCGSGNILCESGSNSKIITNDGKYYRVNIDKAGPIVVVP